MKVICLHEKTSKTFHKLQHKFTLTSINLNFNQPQLQLTSTQYGCDTKATESWYLIILISFYHSD